MAGAFTGREEKKRLDEGMPLVRNIRYDSGYAKIVIIVDPDASDEMVKDFIKKIKSIKSPRV